MAPGRVAVVTGANKGIGLAIVRNLALQYPTSPLKDGSLLIYLTARDKQRGEAALAALEADAQLRSAKALEAHGGPTSIKYHALDIAQPISIRAFRDFLAAKHPGGIDVLVNNAGIAMNGFDNNVVQTTLATNYYGTLAACQELLPLVRAGGRVVNVSSMVGALGKYPSELQEKFRTAGSVDDVSTLMEDFTAAVKEGKQTQLGWPSAAYAVSKAGLTGATRVMGREETARCEREGKPGEARLINACCPGWVVTDMTRGAGNYTPDQGARTPVLLALGDIGGQSGLYWKDEKPRDW